MCEPTTIALVGAAVLGTAYQADQSRKAAHAAQDQMTAANDAQAKLLKDSQTPVPQLLSPEEAAARASGAAGAARSPFTKNPLRLGGTSDGTGLSVPSGG